MERKRIILLATSDINYDQRLQKVSGALVDMGAAVLLVGRKLPSGVDLSERRFQQKRVSCFFNQGVLFYLEINLRFFLLLLKRNFDVVCANDPDTLLAATLASYVKSFEFIYDAHEYFTEVPELEGARWKKYIWAKVEAWGIARASKCYTVNESLVEILSTKYQKDFSLIRNVPYLEKSNIPQGKEKIIIYQGALNKGRGLTSLIRAMQEIDAKLYIAGKGDLQDALLVMVEKMGLGRKVIFLGNLLPEDLKIKSREAMIGVNLLEKSSLNYYYSLANKFFDYMHAGIPSINMAFPEYELINKQFEVSVLISSLDEKVIAKAIQNLLSNETFYEQLKLNCQKAAQSYNWQNESAKLKDIYKL